MTLYELTGQYLELMEMAEDDSVDPYILKDTMDGVEGELEEKADGYAKIIRSLQGDVESIKAEEDRLAYKRKVLENNIKSLQKSLEQAMIATGKKKFKTELFSFSVQKNTPSLDVLDKKKIPKEFWLYQDPKLDHKAALAYIKENGDQEWGQLKQTESLRIR